MHGFFSDEKFALYIDLDELELMQSGEITPEMFKGNLLYMFQVEKHKRFKNFSELGNLPDDFLQELRDLVSQGKKIQAIRLLRDKSKLSLLNCKNFVESI